MRPMASSPRIVTQTCAVRRRTSKREAHLAVHRPSACSGVKALRNTSDAKAASRQAPLAFRSLDPLRALREPDRRRRDEERPSRSEQKTLSKPKTLLDRKSPIQVRIPFPPAASLFSPVPSRATGSELLHVTAHQDPESHPRQDQAGAGARAAALVGRCRRRGSEDPIQDP